MKKKSLTKTEKREVQKVQKNSQQIDLSSISKLVLKGDLSGLTEQEKLNYYGALCKSLGLNPYTKPFEYITFVRGGRQFEMLYATKSCSEQLRKLYDISVIEEKREITDQYVIYDVKVQDKTGRTDTGTGVVALYGWDKDGKPFKLSGTAYADAIMKAQTKAKRRATLSIAGLGVLDETELDFVYAQQNELPNNHKAIDTNKMAIERQELMNKFKELPAEIRKLFADKKIGIDKALEICKKYDFEITSIKVELEAGNAAETEDFF